MFVRSRPVHLINTVPVPSMYAAIQRLGIELAQSIARLLTLRKMTGHARRNGLH